ncbi:hypothetical protein [Streptomyces sp. NPDC053427]|uniref:hypothetical protein n=1 Tax=Streptomyces sp. NPDC053427 TaxID=3365701 RepID=UPI0037D6E729
MNSRTLAMLAVGVMGAIAMPAAPAQAAPQSPSSDFKCRIEAFGHSVPVVCGRKWVNADWDRDGIRDEVFFVSPPNSYVYRISGSSNGPVRVSNGAAYTMDTYEIRPTGKHRIYAVTAGSTRIYSQLDSGGWSAWEKYVP